MDMPKRVQRKRSKGWRMPENTVYVGRPGPWGNPFVVGKDGTAEECVYLYKMLLGGYINLGGEASPELQESRLKHAKENIETLRGKNLACFCRSDKPCHADILLEIANSPKVDG